ncbi:ATP-binding cassette domain-containing protein [Levilactobacillus andaensis]|uniref:ATP-binding cassette domain-containing protein n=1 Tax=Levilactobacillus andaensis TaxID=2799570 RepID=UPI001940F2F7|nr:ABC transporter ATP-binding protein [Levilactobacillus andaensis]
MHVKLRIIPTLKLLAQENRYIVGVAVCVSLINGILPFVIILGNSEILNSLMQASYQQVWQQLGLTYAIYILGQVAVNVGQRYLDVQMVNVDERLKLRLRRSWMMVDFEQLETDDFFAQMNQSETSFRYSGGFAVFMQQLNQTIQSVTSLSVGIGVTVTLIVLGINQSKLMALLSIASLGLILFGEWLGLIWYRRLTVQNLKIFRILMKQERVLNYFLLEVINRYEIIKSIKLNQFTTVIMKHYREQWATSQKTNEAYIGNQFQSRVVTTVMTGLPISVLVALLIVKIRLKILKIGSLNNLFGSLVQVAASSTALVTAYQNLERFEQQTEFIHHQLLKPNVLKKKQRVTAGRVITFENVSFRYASGKLALNHVNLVLPIQGTTAIIGENGSGKTTLVKLLLGLYHPTSGRVTLDGVDIQALNREDYLKLFSPVFQDYAVFDFSLKENMIANHVEDPAMLDTLLRRWQLRPWIQKLPKQLETIVGSYSSENFQPSGGQKQQIALVRGGYQAGKLALLDEPTASLDPLKELTTFQNIKRFSLQQPTIFITHRLGAAKIADRVLLMKSGQLIADGTPEELKQVSPEFRTLWAAQARIYR